MRCFIVAQAQMAEPVTKHMGVLIEYGLEVAVDRVSQDIAPVPADAVLGV